MPSFIRSKHQQYKRDTTQVSTWLGRTAVHHGFPLGDFSRSPRPLEDEDERRTPQQLRNAKKKAKAKKAKGSGLASSAQAGNTDIAYGAEGITDGPSLDAPGGDVEFEKETLTPLMTAQPGDYILKSYQYGEIVNFLIEKGVSIPVELMILLRRCITSRYRCLRRFLSNPDDSTVTHQHFLNVLRRVYDTFAVYRERGTKERSKTVGEEKGSVAVDGSTSGDKSPSNRFAILEVENGQTNEEDEPDIYVPEPPIPSTGQAATGRMTFAPELTLDEGAFTVLAFLDDAHSVRDEIRSLWERYKSGEIDLITAAVTTNTALELLRRPHQHIVDVVLPVFRNSLDVLVVTLYNLLRFSSDGSVLRDLPLFKDVEYDDTGKALVYDYLFVPNWQIIGGLSNVITNDTVPLYKAGYYGHFDPKLDYSKIPFQKRWHQGQILICESLMEYPWLLATTATDPKSTSGEDNFFFIDDIAVEMDRFVKTKECSLLLMVMSQIIIDINFALGATAKRGIDELKRATTAMGASLEARRGVEGPIAPENWASTNELLIKIFKESIDFWRTIDPGQLLYNIINAKTPRALPREQHNSTLLSRDPMLCGLILFRIRLKYQEIGFKLANTWGTILSTAHLFVTCQHSGCLPGRTLPPWADLDLVMEMHGKDDIFGGKAPANVDDSLVSFLQMMGYSRQVLSAVRHVYTDHPLPSHLQDPNAPKPLMSKSGAKGLKDHTQILPIFSKRYSQDPKSAVRLDIHVVETLLSDIRADQLRINEKRSKTKAGVSVQSSGGRRREVKLHRAREHRGPKFSMLQVLSVLEAGLQAETTSIHFDYVSMHLRCIRVLSKIRDSAHEYLVRKVGQEYIENDSQLPFIAGWIFKFAAFSGRAAEHVGIRREGRHAVDVRSKLLVGATDALGDFLRRTNEGSAEMKKMFEG